MNRERKAERQNACIAALVVVIVGAVLYLSLSAPASPPEATPATVNTASVDGKLTSGVEGNDTTDAAEATRAASGSAKVEPKQTGRRPSLRVVLVSDTHGLYQHKDLIKVPPGDMVLLPGDFEVRSQADGDAVGRWLQRLPAAGPRVATWGNMDLGAQRSNATIPGATVLVDQVVEVNGYRIFGSPWTPEFAGAYQLRDTDEAALTERWARVLPPDADVDIVLTHGPPYGIADKARGTSRGDIGLLKAVQALRKPPLLWVCGHIHEGYGEHRVPHPRAPEGSILLVNSAVYYVTKGGSDEVEAQPRVVQLPEAVVVGQGGKQ